MATHANGHSPNTFATKLNRNVRTMPKWVTEASDRIGPKPPAPPPEAPAIVRAPALPPKSQSTPEPDYEVIEFSGQQYSNEPMRPNSAMQMRTKTPESKLKCTLCGSNNPWVTCDECAQQIFCASCDDMFHKHPKRKSHIRKALEQNLPPIPPKTLPGQAGPTAPVAPPRRGKRGMPTPLMQRKDQGQANIPPPSPTPSMRNGSWHDRVGSLKRSLNLMNRPLPDTPKTPTPSEGNGSSRSDTPKSVFDAIQRPPSVTLEKIKNKASATLDRMTQLQQRYRQQKEERERNRSGSVTDQSHIFDQWSSISPSPSNFRSGSMSSGLNSSHFDLSDDSHFNLFHQRQQQQQQMLQKQQLLQQQQRRNGARSMSTSVFNLNNIHRPQGEMNNPAWMNNPMQSAQSMAQLNCAACHNPSSWNLHNQHTHPAHQHHQHHHPEEWSNQMNSQQQLNRSNLSLNVGPGYMMPPHNGMYPPPVFMNQRGMMYPYPYQPGMPVMSPGVIAMPPPSRSRATSRAGSRAASPAMSRKSVSLRRKRSNYHDDEATDDEDSEDDRRSIISTRSGMTGASRNPRQRRLSSASQLIMDEESEARHKARHDHRRGSIAKSVQSEWLPSRRPAGGPSTAAARSSEPTAPPKPSRIYSDLDSEGSGTRALVQAKIQQKLEENSKQKKHRRKTSESDSMDDKRKPVKVSTEVQAGVVKNVKAALPKEPPRKEPVLAKPESEESEEEEEEENVQVQNNSRKPNQAAQKESEEEEEETEEEVSEEEEEEEKEEQEEAEQNGEATGDKEESPPLGPPPSTPDHEWECEFCTYVNEPKVKICAICCKTPSKIPEKPKDSPKTVAKSQTEQKPAKTPEPTRTSKTVAATTRTTGALTNGFGKMKVSTTETETDTEPLSALKKKDSIEDIWAVLDENIQAAADEVIKKAEKKQKAQTKAAAASASAKDRTGARSKSRSKEPVERVAREIGTSPPPQSISTQTYEALPVKKPEATPEDLPVGVQNGLPSSLAEVPAQTPQSYKTNINSQPSVNFVDHNPVEPELLLGSMGAGQGYREFAPQQQPQPQPSFPPMYHERYRSTNDLRYGEPSLDFGPFNGMGRRQASVNDIALISLQKTFTQVHSPLHGYARESPLTYDHKQIRDPETELYILLKEAEMYKFTPEELHAALKYCGTEMHPVQWLRENWAKLIQTVQSLSTKYGQERVENTIGTISQAEAREALKKHTGNIWQAVSECIEQRQRKFRDISSKGNFSREDIVTALTAHQGNVDLALLDLGRTQLKPFLMRIWGSPGGIENESGNMAVAAAAPSTGNDLAPMTSEIHEFLSANASECFQIPNAAGSTFMKDSPFNSHTPDPLLNDTHPTSYSPDQYEPNKNMLKDLETLIGNMEQNQAKQNEHVLKSIEGMLENLLAKKETDGETDPEAMRILTKSPIASKKLKSQPNKEEASEVTDEKTDVKNFVWQHIQDIVPNLVQQVEMELMDESEQVVAIASGTQPEPQEKPNKAPEPPPVDPEEFIMEEVIRPNIREASIREELPPEYVYASEIANFRMEFDRGLDKEHEEEFEFDSLEEAIRIKYRMFTAPEEVKVEEEAPKEDQSNKEQVPVEPVSASPELPEGEEIPSSIVEKALATETEPKEPAPLTEEVKESQEIPSFDGPSTSKAAANEQFARANRNQSFKINKSKQKNKNVRKSSIPQQRTTNAKAYTGKEKRAASAIVESQQPKEEPVQGTHHTETQTHEAISPPTDTNAAPSPLPNQTEESEAPAIASASQITNHSEPAAPSVPIADQTSPTAVHESNTQLINEVSNPSTPSPTNNRPRGSKIPVRRTLSNASLMDKKIAPPKETVNDSASKVEPVSAAVIINADPTAPEEAENVTMVQNSEQLTTEAPKAPGPLTATAEKEPLIQTEPTSSLIDSPRPSTSGPLTSNLPSTQASSSIPSPADSPKENTPQTPTEEPKAVSPSLTEKSDTSSEHFVDAPALSSDEDEENRKLTNDEDEETSEGELYSVESDSQLERDEQMHRESLQSPTSDNEMFFVLPNASNDLPSASHSGPIKLKEFKPSSDPSKQNLSELVEDTQRLIKQMREEINMDDFESDETDYSDENSDEYSDEYDEEEEVSEEEEIDEDDSDAWDDYEEETISEVDEEAYEVQESLERQREAAAEEEAKLESVAQEEGEKASIIQNVEATSLDQTIAIGPDHEPMQENHQEDHEPMQENHQEEIPNHVESESPAESSEDDDQYEEVISESDSESSAEASPSQLAAENLIEINHESNMENNIPELPVEILLTTPTESETTETLINEATPQEPETAILNQTPQERDTSPTPTEPLVNPPPTVLPVDEARADVKLPITENASPELPPEVVVPNEPSTSQQQHQQTLKELRTENATAEIPVETILNDIPRVASEALEDTETVEAANNAQALKEGLAKLITPTEAKGESSDGKETVSPIPQDTTERPSTSASVLKEPKNGNAATLKPTQTKSQSPSKKPQSQAEKPSTSQAAKAEPKVETKRPASKIPQPKQSPKNSRKAPTRSKSFSGPSPIGISSVKALQQQYLSKQAQTVTTTLKPTPNPPTVVRKKSITEAITKFTQVTAASPYNDGPSTSSGFRLRTQPRIPKKKYHETCFSDDDYETTSSEEEPEPLEVRIRKQSVPVFRAYASVQEPETVDPEELARKFVNEDLIGTLAEAQIAAALVNMKFQQDVSLWAARECSDLDQAIALLQQECELCMGTYAMNQMVSMLKCTHKCCKQCAKTYFTVQITDRSINDCNCPYCKTPELHDHNGDEDETLEYFSNLDIFLKTILDPEVHELFQRKLRDRSLMQDPNFKWCIQCSSGFFARPKQRRLICPDCGSVTCSQCRKKWEKQHEGLTCEKFQEWQEANDPEVQVQGVQQHLEQNGIDCPKCKFRYSLARGGCMHFTCTQCKYEFCYGCARPFMMGAKCQISPYCAKLGLHAHHPRNCLFYLRDKLPLQLQFLLKQNNIDFDVEEPEGMAAKRSNCPIPLQKETPTGLVDTVCNGEVPEKHAGMCRTHYVEYLTAKVAKSGIDPLPIFDLTDCVQELRRRGIALPERGPWDTDEIYKGMCSEVIKKNIPLDVQ